VEKLVFGAAHNAGKNENYTVLVFVNNAEDRPQPPGCAGNVKQNPHHS